MKAFPHLSVRQNALLLIVWCLTHAILWWLNGINNSQEALAYEGVARAWLRGESGFSPHFLMYAGYIAIRVAQLWMGWPIATVYLLQSILTLAAAMAFARLLWCIQPNRHINWWGTLLFITCPVISYWNNFLYTDSVFTSLLVIGLYLLVRKPAGRLQWLALWLLVLALPFFRPVGLLFAITCMVYWLIMDAGRYRTQILAALLLCTAGFIGIAAILEHSRQFFYPFHNARMNVICGLPSDLEAQIRVPYDPEKGIISFLLSNPWASLRLFAWRLWKSVWMTRPYFSPAHNGVLAMLLVFYYGLAVRGSFLLKRSHPRLLLFAVISLLIWLAPGMFFCADWANRFILPAFVFILLMAAQAFGRHALQHDHQPPWQSPGDFQAE
ncbi:MAG: hypothetical protein MUF29_07460 [Chitinophagaceae bacterium]|nr:hypothetical protein [Chitinophagaceae bacterium]